VRQARDLAGLVAHDDDLAHLRERDEAVVVGVVLGDALVEQDVLGGLEAGDVERRQAPQVEPAPHHRVHTPHEAVLDERAVDRAEGEVADGTALSGAHGDGDAADVLGEGQLLQQGGELLARGVGGVRLLRPAQVEVDDGVQPGRARPDVVGHGCVERAARDELVDAADRRRQVRRAVVERVVGDGEGPAALGEGAQAVQLVLAVVALDEHLEHRLVLGQPLGRLLVQALGEEADDLLGDGRELVDARRVVGGVGLGGQGGELVADAGEDALALLVDERLVEPAEAHAAGEVADDGEAQLGRHDEAVERLTGCRVERRLRDRLGEPALEDRGGDLHLRG
jgi:hypothetical protein